MIRQAVFALCIAVFGLLGASNAHSQTISQPETRRLPALPEDFVLQPSGFGLPTTGATTPLASPAQKGARGFLLNGVRFEGASVFRDAELRQSLAAFIGRPTTIEDLEVMRQTLTRFYVDAGYINSGAIIPQQQIEEGVVVFRIIEGRLSAVRPFGEEIGDDFGIGGQLAPDYITDRLGITPEQPLNVEQLRESFGLLLEDQMVERLRGQLKPGANPGEAVLDIEVDVRDPISAWISVNNHNSVSNGAIGADGGVILYNLTGMGDISRFNVAVTEGRREGSGRIAVPLLAGRYTPFIEARYSTSEVVESPFDKLNISNEYFRLTAGVNRRLYKNSTEQLDLTVSIDRTSSETRLLDMPFPPSGLNGDVVTAYALRFSQEWVRRGLDEVLALRSTVSFGLDLLDASKGDAGADDGDYASWLGQAQYIRRINDRLRVLGRVQAQFVTGPLPSFEQIGLGGVNTVRGYRANAISVDSGLVFTVETPFLLTDLPLPGLTKPGASAPLELIPFADYGTGWDHGEGFGSRTDLLGVGFGLRWHPIPNISVDLAYGRPLIKDSSIASGSDLTDEAVYLNVTLLAN